MKNKFCTDVRLQQQLYHPVVRAWVCTVQQGVTTVNWMIWQSEKGPGQDAKIQALVFLLYIPFWLFVYFQSVDCVWEVALPLVKD